MPKKNVPINYSARDFASIKESLVQHAKRYYPESFRDFNEAGFGSLMLDTVSYVGDVLSFYLDYQANESFLDTAIEFNNVEKLARQMGFKDIETPTSHGIATFFILIPATQNGLGPDLTYIPILKKNSTLSTSNGNQFILNEDIFFNSGDNDTVVARVNSNCPREMRTFSFSSIFIPFTSCVYFVRVLRACTSCVVCTYALRFCARYF